MCGLCELFPGADTPINYDDCEQDDSECSEDEYMTYDTRDSLTDTHGHTTPHTLQDSQVSNQARPYREIGQVRIPPQFTQEGRSPVTINRTSSSPVHEIPTVSENSNLQDSLQVNSPHVFSESSSPRRLSPIGNYNIGNMNPRHIDIEQYWNRQNDASPLRSPSVTSTTNSKKEDYNQNYCDRLSATNSPMSPATEYNGNMSNLSQRVVDPRYHKPLQIEVDPVSR